jgi:hypothetical protein
MRAAAWLSALAPHARVALVAPEGELPSEAERFDYFFGARSFARGVRGVLDVLRRGLPLQSLLAAPFDWDTAIAAAQREMGGFDATIVILSRVDPWVRASLPKGVKILDAIDSLRRNAEERGKAASMLTRWIWRREERRQARAEQDVARAYDRIVVVNSEEKAELGGSAAAIQNGVNIASLDPNAPRRFDFGFWGRLAYFANADAAMWLIDEIWPRILARNPAVSCVIAGADAPRSIRRSAARRGITLLSPVDDISVLARSIRVALIPVRFGSGQLTKVLEAGEGGCAIAATRHALRGLAPLVPFVRFADDASSFAKAALDLLEADESRAMASALRRAVTASYSREQMLDEMARVAGVRDIAQAVTA